MLRRGSRQNGAARGATMASAVRGLAEIVLMVKDVPAALHFYKDILGLETISPPAMQGPVFLRVGVPGTGVPQQVVLVPRPQDAPDLPADRRQRSVHHIGLEIAAPDLAAERTRLAGLGLEVRTGQHPFLPVEAIYVDDPDGNEVELVAWTGA
jgi:catechol 2,3-dioxygenase-like lactoylglutathione lyase family enzyme